MAATAERSSSSELVLPFVNSARTVLSTMARITSTIGCPYLKNDLTIRHDVSGIIAFTGGIEGTVVIGFQLGVAKFVVNALSGTDVAPSDPYFADCVGELANMIAGSAKKHLNAAASISVPTVIIGTGHTTARVNGVPCVVIPCSTPAGDFAVEVNIKRGKPAQ
jgi:chemotaxis protein CheX